MNAVTRSERGRIEAPTVSFTLNGRNLSAHANETLDRKSVV
jgi:hypothetical protein